MTTAPLSESKQPSRTILIVWAVVATLAALVSTGAAIFFWLQTQRSPVPQPAATTPASPFVDLPESMIPGRYRWISKSGTESFLTLNPDHTFSKDGGVPNPGHRWEITRDALVIFWLRSQNRMNSIERSGVYVELKDGVDITRLEKQE